MSINGSVWTPIGPSPITESGRQDNGMMTAIAVNPNDGDVVYHGTAGGGVWKTARRRHHVATTLRSSSTPSGSANRPE